VPQAGWAIFLLKVAASVGVMACVVFTTMGEARWWLSAPWQLKLPAVLGIALLGAAAYAACLAVGDSEQRRTFTLHADPAVASGDDATTTTATQRNQ